LNNKYQVNEKKALKPLIKLNPHIPHKIVKFKPKLRIMKFLAIEIPFSGIDWSKENVILKDEALQVHRLYLEDCLREIYFNEQHNAVILLECESIEKARELLDSLPLVQKGLIRFNIMKLLPYTGFDRILKV
jgi:hypothetical protein